MCDRHQKQKVCTVIIQVHCFTIISHQFLLLFHERLHLIHNVSSLSPSLLNGTYLGEETQSCILSLDLDEVFLMRFCFFKFTFGLSAIFRDVLLSSLFERFSCVTLQRERKTPKHYTQTHYQNQQKHFSYRKTHRWISRIAVSTSI